MDRGQGQPVNAVERAMVEVRRRARRRTLARAALGGAGDAAATSAFDVLDAVEEAELARTPIGVSGVASALGVDQPRASRLVASAVAAGLVRRGPDQRDGRRARLVRTAAGRAASDEIHRHRRSVFDAAMAGWSALDRAEFARLLTAFVDEDLTQDRSATPTVSGPSLEWVEVTMDCLDVEGTATFWQRLLGLRRLEDPLPGWARLNATVPGGPVLNFQPVSRPTRGKARIHLDLRTNDLPSTLRDVRALGGSYTGEAHVYEEGTVAVMADPEGVVFCVVGPRGSAVPH